MTFGRWGGPSSTGFVCLALLCLASPARAQDAGTPSGGSSGDGAVPTQPLGEQTDAGVPVAVLQPTSDTVDAPEQAASDARDTVVEPTSSGDAATEPTSSDVEDRAARAPASDTGDAALGVRHRDGYDVWAELRAELEAVDVEGPGGFSHSDTLRVAPRSRALSIDIDKVTLDLYARFADWLLSRVEFRGDRERARVDRVYLELEPWAVEDVGHLVLQVGREKPMARPPGRHVETYSANALAFWRGRDWHAGADFEWQAGAFGLHAVGSLQLQRKLGEESVGEDLSLPTFAFRHADPGEDAVLEGGGLLEVSVFGATVGAFGFLGALQDNAGPSLLNTTLSQYALLGDVTDRTSSWYGFRAFLEEHGFFFLAEVVFQRLGLLSRRAFEIGGSYAFSFDLFGKPMQVEPLVRYSQLTITNLPEQFDVPQSWDREQMLFALLLRPLAALELKIEYLVLAERAGMSVEGHTSVKDNQLLIQVLFRADIGVHR